MIRFLIRRLLFGAVVLWLISVAVFVLFYVAPADVAQLLACRPASQTTVEAIASTPT
ncbi:hypothetical protein [Micromonospora sp. CPCC 206061]|uniref:hypothetical protein n=1 Tax=Micromonospora sp. CPCC 206061 TaxID=3122410 RepID=UPI002FF4117E